MFEDLSSERETLRSVRRHLFNEREELISRGRNFQKTLKARHSFEELIDSVFQFNVSLLCGLFTISNGNN